MAGRCAVSDGDGAGRKAARAVPRGRGVQPDLREAARWYERAAELAGVRVKRVKMLVYVISGFCAAMAGSSAIFPRLIRRGWRS